MKKILLIIFVLFLVGCTNTIKEEVTENSINLEKYHYVGTFANGDDVYIEAYRYYMQDAAWSMILVRDNKIIKEFESTPSHPKFSKDRTKILYVDSLQFEVMGNVTIYDSETEEETTYTDYAYNRNQETVKDVEWIDDESILCIVGFAVGTVSQGGKVYKLNLLSKELELVITDEKIAELTDRPNEVVDVYIAENGLKITLIEWTDDNCIDYYYTVHYIPYLK